MRLHSVIGEPPFRPCLQVLCLGINDKLAVARGTLATESLQSEPSVLGCCSSCGAGTKLPPFSPMSEPPIPCCRQTSLSNSNKLPMPAPIRAELFTCLSPPPPRVVTDEDWGGSGRISSHHCPRMTAYVLVPPPDGMPVFPLPFSAYAEGISCHKA